MALVSSISAYDSAWMRVVLHWAHRLPYKNICSPYNVRSHTDGECVLRYIEIAPPLVLLLLFFWSVCTLLSGPDGKCAPPTFPLVNLVFQYLCILSFGGECTLFIWRATTLSYLSYFVLLFSFDKKCPTFGPKMSYFVLLLLSFRGLCPTFQWWMKKWQFLSSFCQFFCRYAARRPKEDQKDSNQRGRQQKHKMYGNSPGLRKWHFESEAPLTWR